MVKIAIISTMGGFPWGGSEFLWAAMAEQALVEGNEVYISIYDWSVDLPQIKHLERKGAHLFLRPRFPSLSSRILKRMSQVSAWLKSIAPQSPYQNIFDCKPDVICLNDGHTYTTVFMPDLNRLLISSSIPYLITCHFNEDSYKLDDGIREAAKKLFSLAARNVFVSYHNLKLAERQLAQPIPHAVVQQNPVNMTDLSFVSWPDQSLIYFATVARLEVAYKGHDILFEALSLPIWQQRDWQYRLYGSGPDQAYLEGLAKHFGIAHRIQFMGHVDDVRSIWIENHIHLLPSRAEGTPLALVESMLCGRPAVVNDVGGNAEWVEEGQTGFIAEGPTPNAFSTALNRAWLAHDNLKEMGVKSHDYAVAKLDKSPGKSFLNLVLEASNHKKMMSD
jgi:L-malate glycosyltransferase